MRVDVLGMCTCAKCGYVGICMCGFMCRCVGMCVCVFVAQCVPGYALLLTW